MLLSRKVRHVLTSARNLSCQGKSSVGDCQAVFLYCWCCQKFSAFMILLVEKNCSMLMGIKSGHTWTEVPKLLNLLGNSHSRVCSYEAMFWFCWRNDSAVQNLVLQHGVTCHPCCRQQFAEKCLTKITYLGVWMCSPNHRSHRYKYCCLSFA